MIVCSHRVQFWNVSIEIEDKSLQSLVGKQLGATFIIHALARCKFRGKASFMPHCLMPTGILIFRFFSHSFRSRDRGC